MIPYVIKSKGEFTVSVENLKYFFSLMKPRVMSLVLFTCMVGLVIAPTEKDIIMVIVSLLAVSLGAGAQELSICGMSPI